MVNYYFSATWAGLEDGTVVNVLGGGTAIIGTDAFAYGYNAVATGIEAYGEDTYGEEWIVTTCDVYVDAAYAAEQTGDLIDLTVANPSDPSDTFDIPGALVKDTNAFGSDDIDTAAKCKAVLEAARDKVSSNGVGAIIITDDNDNSTYAFGSLSSTGGFFANGKTLIINGGTFSSSNFGVAISGGGANATINNGKLVTDVIVNEGYISNLWAGGANGTIKETNFTLNGGSVGVIGGGYSGNIGTANFYVYGGNFNSLLATQGAGVTDANITIDTNGGTITGFVSVTGNATAQAVRLTNDFNLVVRNTTMTKGTTGNRGGTVNCNNINMSFVDSFVSGTIGINTTYAGITPAAVVNGYVISVDGSSLNVVSGSGVTMNSDNKRTIKATGDNSTISSVVAMDEFFIDADTCLTVSNLSATTAALTVDATDFVLAAGDSKAVLVVTKGGAPTGTYTVLENGSVSDKYTLVRSGGTVSIVVKPAIFSAGWEGLADGTVVSTTYGDMVIGTNAFVTYAEAAASGMDPVAGDIYCNNDWTDGDTVTIYGYTTTVNGSDAKNSFAAARSAYSSRVATEGGVLYFVGGTYNDGSGTGTGQTQCLNGYKTILRDVEATTIIAGYSGSVSATTDLTVKGSTITNLIYGGARANVIVTDNISIDISDSVVNKIGIVGAGLASSDAPGSAQVKITGSTITMINAGQNVYGDIDLTITGSRVTYLGGAGQGDKNVFVGNMTYNLTDTYVGKMYSNKGINDEGGQKRSYVQGDVVINVAGTTTIDGAGQIGFADSNSTTINLKADSLLTLSSSLTLASYVNITIDVDGYTGVGEKLVMTGKNTASNNITITGEDADKYSYKREGTNLYVVRAPDAYFSIGWTDLDDGDVVTVAGGTAVIGTNAFATYDAAVAAVGDFVKSADVYFSYDWTGASTGDVVDVTTPGGTFSATIGTDAFATLSSALSNAGSDGYVHVVGGSTALTSRVGLLQKDVWFTNTVITAGGTQGDLCGVYGSGTNITDGRANVVIGEGSSVDKYYVSRGNFGGNAVVTVRDGGHVGTLSGGCTSATFTAGTTTINVLKDSSVGSVWGTGSGNNVHDVNINISDSQTGNVIGTGMAQSSLLTGSVKINVSGSTVGNVATNNTGKYDATGGTTSIIIDKSSVASVTLAAGTVYNNGLVWVDIKDSNILQFVGPKGGGDDVTLSFSGTTVTNSITPITSGVYGVLNESLTNSLVNNYYYILNGGGTVSSMNVNMSNSRVVSGIQGVTGAGTLVTGDVMATLTDVVSANFYGVAGGSSVEGNYDVSISGGSFGEFRFVSGTASIAGTKRASFVGGTTSITTMRSIYTNTADFVISSGATLSVADYGISFNSLTLDGELVLTNAAYTTAVSADGFASIVSNASGNGTVTVGDLATGALISSDNTLYAYLLEQPVIYVNADWTSEVANNEVFTYDSKTLLGGVSAFTSADDAKAFAGDDSEIIVIGFTAGTAYYGDGGDLEIRGGSSSDNVYAGSQITVSGSTITTDNTLGVSGGTFKGLVAGDRAETIAEIAGDSLFTMDSGSAQSAFGGSYVDSTGNATISGDSTAAISGGSFSSFVCGGNVVATGGTAYLSGDSLLAISGGVFNGAVAGGSDSQGGKLDSSTGYTSTLTITGGTFAKSIYGGNVASKLAYATLDAVSETLIDINGSTFVNIDSSVNNIVINGNIIAGSYGQGQITGDTTVTFTGLGSNLDFTGKLSGDSQNAGTYNKCVTGTRSLVFDNFTGGFSGNIRGIDSVSFSNGSSVTLDAGVKQFYLKYANEWNFSDSTSLTWTNGFNDFSGDKMNLSFNDFDSEWSIFTGSESTLANFDDMSVSFNGGAYLSYDEGISGYSDGSYALTVDSNNIMKLAKLA